MEKNKIGHLTKEFLIVGIGQGLTVLGSILGLKLFTKYLNPNEFGMVNLSLTISLFASQIIFGPIAGASLRFYSKAIKQNQIKEFFSSTVFLTKIGSYLTILLGFLCVGFYLFISKENKFILTNSKQWIPLTIISIIYSLVLGFSSVLNALQIAARQRIIVAILQCLSVLLRFGLGISFYLIIFNSSFNVLLGFLVSISLIFTIQLYFFNKIDGILISFKYKKNIWLKRLANYLLPFSYWGIFTWGLLSSDKWALQIFFSAKEVGLYSSAYQFGFAPILLLSGVLESFAAPIIFQRMSLNSDKITGMNSIFKLFKKIIIIIILLLIIVVIILFNFHNFIFSLLIGENYLSVSVILPYLFMGASFFSLGQFLSIFILAVRNSKILLPIKVGIAIIGTFFNFSGAYFYGIKGVAVALSLTYFIYFLWVLIISISIKNKLNLLNYKI